VNFGGQLSRRNGATSASGTSVHSCPAPVVTSSGRAFVVFLAGILVTAFGFGGFGPLPLSACINLREGRRRLDLGDGPFGCCGFMAFITDVDDATDDSGALRVQFTQSPSSGLRVGLRCSAARCSRFFAASSPIHFFNLTCARGQTQCQRGTSPWLHCQFCVTTGAFGEFDDFGQSSIRKPACRGPGKEGSCHHWAIGASRDFCSPEHLKQSATGGLDRGLQDQPPAVDGSPVRRLRQAFKRACERSPINHPCKAGPIH
jgi:hypothetical protein